MLLGVLNQAREATRDAIMAQSKACKWVLVFSSGFLRAKGAPGLS